MSSVYISFDELCQCVSISEAQVVDLVEQGVLRPEAGLRQDEWRFSHVAVTVVGKAERLHHQLAVEWADMPLVLELLEELTELRAENSMLKQRLKRFLIDQN